VSRGGDTKISIGGDQTGNIAVGESVINVSGSERILDPGLAPGVMVQLDEIVRRLEAYREAIPDPKALLEAARSAAEEVRAEQPRIKLILDRLKDISSGIQISASLVAAVGPLVDAAAKLVH